MSESLDTTQTLAGNVLVVDDERNIRRALRMVLEGEGARVWDCETAEDALALLAKDDPEIEVALVDVLLPGMSGLELLEHLGADKSAPSVPIIMISGHASVEDAVRATRLGAFDFFEKPLARDRVIVSVRNALRQYRADEQLRTLRAQVRRDLLGNSIAMQNLFDQIAKVGKSRARVLIHGESGTGKELVARAIHDASERSTRAFVKVNCAAIAPELIESELFGHERGAFTGATHQKRGLFEIADGGTLFLDEIGDMSQSAQAKVLRVLQSNELMRVGSEKTISVDVRVLAATHRNLQELVVTGEFREDLYFRLAVVPIEIPPLRARREDIELLARGFIDQACRDNGMRDKQLEPQALAALVAYDWPGNVRELRNVVERMVILSDGDLTVADVPGYVREASGSSGMEAEPLVDWSEGAVPPGVSLRAFREALERTLIVQRLKEQGWNVSRTAEALGIERTHLHKKMKLLGIQRGDA